MDMENIMFMSRNNIQLWSDKLEFLFKDQALYSKLIVNGQIVIEDNFNINYFYKELKKLILN